MASGDNAGPASRAGLASFLRRLCQTPFFRNHNPTVWLTLSDVWGQRTGRRPRQDPAVSRIETPIMAWAPNYGLPRQKRHCASFMRAFRAECVQLILGLQNQHPLPTHRHDDKLVLLQFGRFVSSQPRRPRRAGLRQRFEITNDWISDAHQPAEEAHAQENVEKMAARSCRSRRGLFIHRRFPYALIAPRSSICSDGIDLLFCSRIKRITPKVGGRKNPRQLACSAAHFL